MKFQCPICGRKYSFSPISCSCGHRGPFTPLFNEDEKREPATPQAVIGLLVGMATWVMTKDGLSALIAAVSAFLIASTKTGMFIIRVIVLLGLAWLALVFFT